MKTKTHRFDAAGVLASVSEIEGDGTGSSWSFTDPIQAKRHAPMFAADLNAEQLAKLEAVKLPEDLAAELEAAAAIASAPAAADEGLQG